MQGTATKISSNQQKALLMLLDGKKHVEIAELLGINEATIWRWQQTPEFSAAYNEARKAQLDHAFNVLQSKFERAVEVLDALLVSDQSRDALKAAEIIIDRSIKLAVLTERIAELEAEVESLRAEQNQAGLIIFDINELTTEERSTLRAINEAIAQRTP